MVLTLTQAVINGILIGGVYALIAVGLTLVFGIMDIVNFAQSEFLMMGMFFAYIAISKFSDWIRFSPRLSFLRAVFCHRGRCPALFHPEGVERRHGDRRFC